MSINMTELEKVIIREAIARSRATAKEFDEMGDVHRQFAAKHREYADGLERRLAESGAERKEQEQL